MEQINQKVGERIRNFRKKRSLTLVDLSQKLNKSKATVSKYERGEIVVDIQTLYEIAEVLDVHINQLLFFDHNTPITTHSIHPAFFSGLNQFYSYVFDGRANQVLESVFDIVPTEDSSTNEVYMYMNVQSIEEYQVCENTYHGVIEHYDAVTNLRIRNLDTPMEQVSISILASFLESNTKWGLFFGLSSRPMMPVSMKMLFTREPLKIDKELTNKLKLSKEDVRLLKHYNMFSAT